MKKGLNRFRSDEHSTLSILLKKYDRTIRLDNMCEEYFGLNYETARKHAKKCILPISAFQLGDSQKLPWFVDTIELADHIDKRAAQAKKKWDKFQ